MRLIINIAGTLLLARWRQTLVAAIGVTFSIAMFIALLGFMNGLNSLLDGLVLNRTPHIRLYNEIKPKVEQPVSGAGLYPGYYHFIRSVRPANSRLELYNSGAIVQALQKDGRVQGVSPRVSAQVFFTDGPVDITGMVNGMDVIEENRLFRFGDYIVSGQYIDLKNLSNSIILGKPLAEKLLVNIGDVVQVTTAKGEIFSLKVVGLFQSGLSEYDKVQSFASLETVQKLLGQTERYITDINVKLFDLKTAPSVAREFRQIFGCDAIDIQTANAEFETGSSIRSLISYVVGIVLLIVAGFGIYNILNMMIYEKMDTIAILKATGFSGADVKRIFLVIALSIGFFGGVTGLLLGNICSHIIDQIPFHTAALPTVTTYPVSYNILFYLIGFIFSLATTWFAGWFPSRKASRVDPVVIIRGK